MLYLFNDCKENWLVNIDAKNYIYFRFNLGIKYRLKFEYLYKIRYTDIKILIFRILIFYSEMIFTFKF